MKIGKGFFQYGFDEFIQEREVQIRRQRSRFREFQLEPCTHALCLDHDRFRRQPCRLVRLPRIDLFPEKFREFFQLVSSVKIKSHFISRRLIPDWYN